MLTFSPLGQTPITRNFVIPLLPLPLRAVGRFLIAGCRRLGQRTLACTSVENQLGAQAGRAARAEAEAQQEAFNPGPRRSRRPAHKGDPACAARTRAPRRASANPNSQPPQLTSSSTETRGWLLPKGASFRHFSPKTVTAATYASCCCAASSSCAACAAGQLSPLAPRWAHCCCCWAACSPCQLPLAVCNH